MGQIGQSMIKIRFLVVILALNKNASGLPPGPITTGIKKTLLALCL